MDLAVCPGALSVKHRIIENVIVCCGIKIYLQLEGA
uniref:Uncharacterized protein n=1 Tax=Anguilla anguilla TaxID=7936 RepID=A0A0E9TB22_ANGAN